MKKPSTAEKTSHTLTRRRSGSKTSLDDRDPAELCTGVVSSPFINLFILSISRKSTSLSTPFVMSSRCGPGERSPTASSIVFEKMLLLAAFVPFVLSVVCTADENMSTVGEEGPVEALFERPCDCVIGPERGERLALSAAASLLLSATLRLMSSKGMRRVPSVSL